MKTVNEEKFYYKLTNSITGDEIYAVGDKSVNEEALLELLGLANYTAERITKEEYDVEADDLFN